MLRPPRDPRTHRPTIDTTWDDVLAAFAMVLAIPVVLWAASNPVASAAVVVTGGGLAIGTRGALRFRRCLYECGGFAVDMTDDVRVCVTRESATAAC